MKNSRKSGVLLHPTSLPSRYPIGDLGKNAYRFIDIINDAGFTLWQILPVNPVNHVNSPYMSSSSTSFNELLIDPEILLRDGLIDKIPEYHKTGRKNFVDYDSAREFKKRIILSAYNRFDKNNKDFRNFCCKNEYLEDNAVFAHLLDKYKADWSRWPASCMYENIKDLRKKYRDEVEVYLFGQYIVQGQWKRLKNYAEGKGLKIIGDLPIYVDFNSCDVWANKSIFSLSSRTGTPKEVSGVPPDYFSKDGQLWNNPLYKWFDNKQINKKLMSWWYLRIKFLLNFVDIIRIDHFRGFIKYWAVKYGEKTAKNGRWRKGPGKRFFELLFNKTGKFDIIAEDLGIITRDIEKTRIDLGFPGMKVLQFAFSDPSNTYLPVNFDNTDYVVYTGTHDNNTTLGWYKNDISEKQKHFLNLYTQRDVTIKNASHVLIYCALSSTAKWAVIPVQDLLNLDENHRMNIPSVAEKNWCWKMEESDLDNLPAETYRNINLSLNRYSL